MTVFSIRSQDLEAARRVEEFQAIAANICKLHITPADAQNYRSETVIGLLPGIIMADTVHSACTTDRTNQLAAETGDNILLHIPVSGGFSIRQDGGHDVECAPGQVYVDPNEVPGVAEFRSEQANVFYVSIPRSFLASATAGLNTALRDVTALTPQWRLFLNYARSLHEELPHLAPEDAMQCAAHVQDLALMALGATREAAELAAGRGVRAARLKAVKADIERLLTSPDLTPDLVAARQGVSPRYLRSLFESDGMSFRDYVASRRLLMAYRQLADPTYRTMTISQIAMQAGFGDLSWFNARFKSAFGATPSDVRARAFTG
ncbi:AraC family transcriptional regulator [Pelagibacterium lentulum]|uniref:AraC family transcriptional regulator n=1 Tax=Pelagibacterium lentulum TaxID=2029865 RepID=A0A916RLB4_9HYPH|nr:AraC family transcriptional regulator [Pelagibacterium lentulum]GGA60798.1 AraC family transcriptional regulator [Pelagibacterium lentulum]